jgi:hypothetical protein
MTGVVPPPQPAVPAQTAAPPQQIVPDAPGLAAYPPPATATSVGAEGVSLP